MSFTRTLNTSKDILTRLMLISFSEKANHWYNQNETYHNKVWRSDARHHDIVFQNGFHPRNYHDQIWDHIHYKPGQYISFATKMANSRAFNNGSSYMYLTNYPLIHIDIVDISYALNRLHTITRDENHDNDIAGVENEISNVNAMASSDIVSARKFIAIPGIGIPYKFTGALFKNSHYVPRNFSIGILSADIHEAQRIETILRDVRTHKEEHDYISYAQAKDISEALLDISKSFEVKSQSPIVFIEETPKGNDPVKFACEQYYAHNKKHNIARKYPSTNLFSTEKKSLTVSQAIEEMKEKSFSK